MPIKYAIWRFSRLLMTPKHTLRGRVGHLFALTLCAPRITAISMIGLVPLVGCETDAEPKLPDTAKQPASPAESHAATASRTEKTPIGRAMDQLFGAFNEYRLHGDWSTVVKISESTGGRGLPDHMLPPPGVAKGSRFGFLFFAGRRLVRASGFNSESNSISVTIRGVQEGDRGSRRAQGSPSTGAGQRSLGVVRAAL